MDFAKKRTELGEQLELLPDAYERLEYVVDLGREHGTLPDDEKTPERKVEGCVSEVFLICEAEAGMCRFRVDADSAIVKGIAAILCNLYSGERPEVIIREEPAFLEKFGITQHLSPNRRNGLTQIYKRMVAFATAQMAGTPANN